MMRTTLNIDADVLRTATQLASRSGQSLGAAISSLARAGISMQTTNMMSEPQTIFGFRPFPHGDRVVSNQLINRLRQSGEY